MKSLFCFVDTILDFKEDLQNDWYNDDEKVLECK
jgi:hypothetical protein